MGKLRCTFWLHDKVENGRCGRIDTIFVELSLIWIRYSKQAREVN